MTTTNTATAANGGLDGDHLSAPLVPPHALRDYVFLGDGYRGVIIGPPRRRLLGNTTNH